MQIIFFHPIKIKISLWTKYFIQGISFPGLPCQLKFNISKLYLEIFLFSEEKLSLFSLRVSNQYYKALSHSMEGIFFPSQDSSPKSGNRPNTKDVDHGHSKYFQAVVKPSCRIFRTTSAPTVFSAGELKEGYLMEKKCVELKNKIEETSGISQGRSTASQGWPQWQWSLKEKWAFSVTCQLARLFSKWQPWPYTVLQRG